jgi:hypothetical protein
MAIGFPWILSSESRLINGLRGKNRAAIFLGAFVLAADGAGDRGLVEGRDCSWGNLNQFSDFLQEIVAGRVPGVGFPFSLREKVAAP